MLETTVVVIGGGATGLGVLRDLSMRGVGAVLLEQGDVANGTSARFHGLLHSGGRYVVKDPDSARECIAENAVLRRIGAHCVEETEGFFVRVPEDDQAWERRWVDACRATGLQAVPIDPAEAVRLEPDLARDACAVYRVPDAAIDGFRLICQNAISARRHGGRILSYTQVTGVRHAGGRIAGVSARNVLTGAEIEIACQVVVSAAGSWAGEIARLAGLDVPVKPDRGTLVAFNHRFTSRVVNRLRPPSDGDIFVPHGSITILGTTSTPAARPDDNAPRREEVLRMLDIGGRLFPQIHRYRILRAFTGTRPLLGGGGQGREASRNFALLDHARDGLRGMFSIIGGKLTTYRLMAQAATDAVCRELGWSAPCRTALEAIIEDPPARLRRRARRELPPHVGEVTLSRVGPALGPVLERLRAAPEARQLVCECEMVTRAEVEEVASQETTHSLDDVRRRTRVGMGTCQGSFCALRTVDVLAGRASPDGREPLELLREFLQARWRGIRPALWGKQLREAELMRGIYQATLAVDGGRAP